MTFISGILLIFMVYLLLGYCLLWWLIKGLIINTSYKEWIIIILFWPLFFKPFLNLKIMNEQLKYMKRQLEKESLNED